MGLVIPFVGYALLLTVYEQLAAWNFISSEGLTQNFRIRTIGLLAICLNIIPFQIFKNRYYFDLLRGVVLATFLCAALWFIKYGRTLL